MSDHGNSSYLCNHSHAHTAKLAVAKPWHRQWLLIPIPPSTSISQGDSVCICMEQRPFDPHLQGAYSGVSTPMQTFGSLLSASELEETTWPEETTGLMVLCLQEGRAQVQHCRRMKTTRRGEKPWIKSHGKGGTACTISMARVTSQSRQNNPSISPPC